MISQSDNQGINTNGGFTAVLELLCLSQEEERAALEFLEGRTGEEALAGFTFQDLADVPDGPVLKLFTELLRRKKNNEVKRLFLLLFARGQATCYRMLPVQLYGQEEFYGVDAAKRTAVYGAAIGQGAHYPSVHSLNRLLEFADHQPDTLGRALEYEKNKFINGKLVLLAMYFKEKYENLLEAAGKNRLDALSSCAVRTGEGDGCACGIKAISNSFSCAVRTAERCGSQGETAEAEGSPAQGGTMCGQPKGGGGIRLAAEDIPMLARYEEYAVAGFSALYFRNAASLGFSPGAVYPEEDPQLWREWMAALAAPDGGMERLRPILAGAGHGSAWTLFRLTVSMSCLNYMLSDRLRNIVRLCAAADPEDTLNVMQDTLSGTPSAPSETGGVYDRLFGIDSEILIRWAYGKGFFKVLKRQIVDHAESYLAVMGTMKLEDANKMLALIREQDSALHARVLAERGLGGPDGVREKVIAELVKKSADAELAGRYLRGACGADALFPVSWPDGEKHYYAGGNERDLVDSYLANYEDAEFFRRCEIYMLLNRGGYFFRRDVTHSADLRETADAQGVKRIFADFEAEGVPPEWQVSAVSLIYDTLLHEAGQKSFLAEAADIFEAYLSEDARREEFLRAFAGADALGRIFVLSVLRRDVGRNKKEILAYSQDGAKSVRQELLDILCAGREFEPEVLELLSAKRAAERELAVRALICWQESGAETDYRGAFRQALEKEKNAKVRELLRGALNACGGGEAAEQTRQVLPASQISRAADDSETSEMLQIFPSQNIPDNLQILPVSRGELVKELHGGGAARGLAWAYKIPFPAVHRQNGELAEQKYLQAVLLCYYGQRENARALSVRKNKTGGAAASDPSESGYGLSRNAAFLTEDLDSREFAAYVNELFDRWLTEGAEAKKRFVLYAAAIHGGSAAIGKLTRQIREWSQHGRSAIACEAVRALSLNPLPQALLAVDEMTRKSRSGQVRAAAAQVLQFAAVQQNLTREELADRIVPDFGFDGNAERYFDYGTRGFYVAVTAELEIEVFEAVLCRDEEESACLTGVNSSGEVPRRKEEGSECPGESGIPAEISCRKEEDSGCPMDSGISAEKSCRKVDDSACLTVLEPSMEVSRAQGKRSDSPAAKEAAGRKVSQADVLPTAQTSRHGRRLKTLPVPGKKDDAKKAAAAYEEFRQLKKQLKTTAEGQKQRMEQAMATAREWDADAWTRFFVQNPVMRPFAIRLVWGVYESGRLVQSFRYMEDGTLNTEDGEEFMFPASEGGSPAGGKIQAAGKTLASGKTPFDEELTAGAELTENGKSKTNGQPLTNSKFPADGIFPENGKIPDSRITTQTVKIRLLHPMELPPEKLAAWKEQLSDYEITQPIGQLDREIFTVTEEEAKQRELLRLHGRSAEGAVFNSRLLELGWQQSPVEDVGRFFAYYREDAETGLAARLEFSGNCRKAENEEIIVYGIKFYRIGEAGRNDYVYGAADEEKACRLGGVPARYFSEILWQAERAIG